MGWRPTRVSQTPICARLTPFLALPTGGRSLYEDRHHRTKVSKLDGHGQEVCIATNLEIAHALAAILSVTLHRELGESRSPMTGAACVPGRRGAMGRLGGVRRYARTSQTHDSLP